MTLDFSQLFFSDFPGSLLQTLPFAAAAGAVFWLLKYRKDKTAPLSGKVWSVLFVCYSAEVICMVFFFSSIRYFWGSLFLNNRPDNIIKVLFCKGTVNLIPDFYKNIDRENILNMILFMPFGILYPLAKRDRSWIRTVLTGVICVIGAEVLQPMVGRSFDVNDIILNTAGVFISASLFFLIAWVIKRLKRNGY